MDIGLVMNTMRDSAGIPSHPLVFQFLMVVTWVFHIAFVHLTLGAGAMGLYAFIKRQQDSKWEQLSIAMTKVAKVSVSMAVVLGVAPLLFTQVIYDPQWYFSNVISATWVIGFILTLIIGYTLWFVFYFKNHDGASNSIAVYGLIGLGLMLFDGFIMHVLSYQSLLPEQWMSWYAPTAGQVDTSGTGIHAYQWQRFSYVIVLSLVMIGAYLMAYADYFNPRADKSGDYLTWARKIGARLALAGLVISLPLLALWYVDLPVHVADHTTIAFIAVSAISIMGLVFFWFERDNRFEHGYRALVIYAALMLALAVLREAVRMAYLNPLGYDIMTYKVVEDWSSTVLFFSTFIVVGGLVGGFYLSMLYKAGRVVGEYQADTSVARLGTSAVAILVVWIAVFFAVGIWTWLGNIV